MKTIPLHLAINRALRCRTNGLSPKSDRALVFCEPHAAGFINCLPKKHILAIWINATMHDLGKINTTREAAWLYYACERLKWPAEVPCAFPAWFKKALRVVDENPRERWEKFSFFRELSASGVEVMR